MVPQDILFMWSIQTMYIPRNGLHFGNHATSKSSSKVEEMETETGTTASEAHHIAGEIPLDSW